MGERGAIAINANMIEESKRYGNLLGESGQIDTARKEERSRIAANMKGREPKPSTVEQ